MNVVPLYGSLPVVVERKRRRTRQSPGKEQPRLLAAVFSTIGLPQF